MRRVLYQHLEVFQYALAITIPIPIPMASLSSDHEMRAAITSRVWNPHAAPPYRCRKCSQASAPSQSRHAMSAISMTIPIPIPIPIPISFASCSIVLRISMDHCGVLKPPCVFNVIPVSKRSWTSIKAQLDSMSNVFIAIPSLSLSHHHHHRHRHRHHLRHQVRQ